MPTRSLPIKSKRTALTFSQVTSRDTNWEPGRALGGMNAGDPNSDNLQSLAETELVLFTSRY